MEMFGIRTIVFVVMVLFKKIGILVAQVTVQYFTFGISGSKLVGNPSVKGKVTHWEKNGSVNIAVKCFVFNVFLFSYIICLFMVSTIINDGNWPRVQNV